MEIHYLKNYPQYVPLLAQWAFDAWGQYNPEASIEKNIHKFTNHLNDTALPLTLIAFLNNEPVGMCSLRTNDGIRPELKPWLASLYVHPSHRKKGIAEILIKAIVKEARRLDFENLYLLAFDSNLPQWYQRLGWQPLGSDSLNNHPVTVMSISLQNPVPDKK